MATWKDTGRLEDMLEANRIVLDDLAPRMEGTIGDGVRLHGKVIVERGAQLSNCTVRGPAIIGENTVIDDAYIGPYTSIYYGCTVRNAELEHSIVLENSVIENVEGKIEVFADRQGVPDRAIAAAAPRLQADGRRPQPGGAALMAWMQPTADIEAALARMEAQPGGRAYRADPRRAGEDLRQARRPARLLHRAAEAR